MTPEQKIKHAILVRAAELNDKPLDIEITSENIDAAYDALAEEDDHFDALEEVRRSGTSTGLPCQSSRHYEAESVAARMPDGSWVGWTYWYGGGKHGEPASVDWMSYAYALDCVEEEKLVTVRTFTKAK